MRIGHVLKNGHTGPWKSALKMCLQSYVGRPLPLRCREDDENEVTTELPQQQNQIRNDHWRTMSQLLTDTLRTTPSVIHHPDYSFEIQNALAKASAWWQSMFIRYLIVHTPPSTLETH
eukprot:PhF_6_TR32149/c0_g1_i2/m.47640